MDTSRHLTLPFCVFLLFGFALFVLFFLGGLFLKKTNKGHFPAISEGVCLLFSKWFFFFPLKLHLCFILGFLHQPLLKSIVAVVFISQSFFFFFYFAFPACLCFSLSKRSLKHPFLKHKLLSYFVVFLF